MHLNIESPISLTALNRQFRAIYPNLRLESINSKNTSLVLHPINEGKIFISPLITIEQLEGILKDNYGIPLKVAWRMGANWVSTLEDPGKTVEEINRWSKIYDASTKVNFFTLFL